MSSLALGSLAAPDLIPPAVMPPTQSLQRLWPQTSETMSPNKSFPHSKMIYRGLLSEKRTSRLAGKGGVGEDKTLPFFVLDLLQDTVPLTPAAIAGSLHCAYVLGTLRSQLTLASTAPVSISPQRQHPVSASSTAKRLRFLHQSKLRQLQLSKALPEDKDLPRSQSSCMLSCKHAWELGTELRLYPQMSSMCRS